MKIVDSIMFNNELDILEARLDEHYEYVDCFYVVESTKSLTYRNKPLVFQKNRSRFNKWKDKINHIAIDGKKEFCPIDPRIKSPARGGRQAKWGSPRYNEFYQRFYLKKLGIPADYFLFLDCDEIIHRVNFEKLILAMEQKPKIIRTPLNWFECYFNNFIEKPFPVAKIYRGDVCRSPNFKRNDVHVFKDRLGVHLSTMGGTEMVLEKLRNSCRTADKKIDVSYIEESLRSRKRVWRRSFSYKLLTVLEGLEMMPNYIKENYDLYRKYFYETV
jgi:hypothetical protein